MMAFCSRAPRSRSRDCVPEGCPASCEGTRPAPRRLDSGGRAVVAVVHDALVLHDDRPILRLPITAAAGDDRSHLHEALVHLFITLRRQIAGYVSVGFGERFVDAFALEDVGAHVLFLRALREMAWAVLGVSSSRFFETAAACPAGRGTARRRRYRWAGSQAFPRGLMTRLSGPSVATPKRAQRLYVLNAASQKGVPPGAPKSPAKSRIVKVK